VVVKPRVRLSPSASARLLAPERYNSTSVPKASPPAAVVWSASSSLWEGAVVPMPTLPSLLKTISGLPPSPSGSNPK